MKSIHSQKALYDAKKNIAQIVTDVVNLENINYTVPEVQTLLSGITVGGYSLQDEMITLNQITAWKFLFNQIETKTFEVSQSFICALHAHVAKQEALTWGEFRTGSVTIAGTSYRPPLASELNQHWTKLALQSNTFLNTTGSINPAPSEPSTIVNLYTTAIHLFAKIARTQFFWDGNKRTGRMMMNGVLLSQGYPMINIPAKRQLEFNQVMLDYYNTATLNTVYHFFISCIPFYIFQEYDLKILKNKHQPAKILP